MCHARLKLLSHHCPGMCLFYVHVAAVLRLTQGSPSTSDTSITAEPPSQLCQNCTLKTLNIQMSSPFGWDASL